jgi:hypothetical protein
MLFYIVLLQYICKKIAKCKFPYVNFIVIKSCELFNENINNEECFSFHYWAYDDYQAGKNICMTHSCKYSNQSGICHMPNNETKHSSLSKCHNSYHKSSCQYSAYYPYEGFKKYFNNYVVYI